VAMVDLNLYGQSHEINVTVRFSLKAILEPFPALRRLCAGEPFV
jgi:hypothetical protein